MVAFVSGPSHNKTLRTTWHSTKSSTWPDLRGTKCLPFVDGTIARFRYYAGVPLNPYNGPNIGTVFLFNEQPCDAGSSAVIRSYLTEIAVHITKHLEQAVEALEGKRVLRFNRGIEALVKTGAAAVTDIDSKASLPDGKHGRQSPISNHYPDFVLRIHQSGAALLQDIFDFDGVRIQEMRATGDFINSNPNWNGSRIMAQYLRPDIQEPGEVSDELLDTLLETFPAGAVFQIASEPGAVIAATSAIAMPTSVGDTLAVGLSKAFPQAQQVILMPLWDPHFERNIGAVLGYACDQSRVYLSGSDLSSMSAFCTTLMTQVRRLEVQATDRIKSDFLGSVSHELRTPLQGILSSLELLTDTSSNELQHELVQMARYSGMSLLDIINRILHFSKISSRAQLGIDISAQTSTGQLSKQPSLRNLRSISTLAGTAPTSIIDVCENIILGAAQRLRLKKTVRPELFDPSHSSNSQRKLSIAPAKSTAAAHQLTIVFDTNAKSSCRLIAGEDFETVLMNLLVR
jgi:signal transduction histidine kinase